MPLYKHSVIHFLFMPGDIIAHCVSAWWCQKHSTRVHQSEGRISPCFLITEDMPGGRFPLIPSCLDRGWQFLVKSKEQDLSFLLHCQVRTERIIWQKILHQDILYDRRIKEKKRKSTKKRAPTRVIDFKD